MADRTPTDLVVVLPGITGSTLHKDGKPVWEPSGGALLNALLTLGGSLRSLALPAGIGDDHPGDGVTVGALVDDVHVIPGIWTPIRGYTLTLERLRRLGYREPTDDRPGNLLAMPYDWRLSNRYTAGWIAPTIERELGRWRGQGGRYADATVTFVCHSMGGLVARWYAAHQGAGLVGRIVTFGTPMRGSLNAVDQLVNGAPAKMGPLRGLITDLGRSMPSLHQLLPSYACLVDGSGAEPEQLQPSSLPGVDSTMAADALAFHEQLETAEAGNPTYASQLHAIVGTSQPTQSSVRVTGGGVEIYGTYGDDDFQGDGTVPLVGAVPKGVALDSNTLRRVPEQHGSLQCNSAALDELEGILTAKRVVIKGGLQVPLSVTVPPIVGAGEPVQVEVAVGANRPALRATLRRVDSGGPRGRARSRALRIVNDVARVDFPDLPPGAYAVDVAGAPGAPVAPVSATTLVWDGGPQRRVARR